MPVKLINGEFLPFFENPKLKNVEEKAEELIGLRYETVCTGHGASTGEIRTVSDKQK